MRGFTLIETVVYVALLGLLMTSAVLAAYELSQSTSIVNVKTAVQDEGNFVTRKIEWAMSSASNVTMSGSDLVITRWDSNTITFHYNTANKSVEIRETSPAVPFQPITTANVSVESPTTFSVLATIPKGVAATTTIKSVNGTDAPQTFTLTKYLRI